MTSATYKPFDLLPAELIYEISSWLLLSSAVLLSLCSRKLRFMLGSECLQNLPKRDPHNIEQALMLQALDRDLPSYLYCFPCHKLHNLGRRIKGVANASDVYREVSTWRCSRHDGTHNAGTAYFRQPEIKFEHIQMAM